jgi:hypothetical protein
MAIFIDVIGCDRPIEWMIRYESFSHWGMIETWRTEPYTHRPGNWR